MPIHQFADRRRSDTEPPTDEHRITIGDWDESARPARSSGFQVRRLKTAEDFDGAVTLQQEVWGESFSEVVPAGVLKVVQFVGGVAAGAFTAEGEMAGIVFGVSGIRDGLLSHWSDTLAVRPSFRNRGLGEDLKWYQRHLLLAMGIERVFWTFDPLESRNAYLNFARLGVIAGEYRRDFYGATHSQLHDAIGTDRLVATWCIDSARVVGRLERWERRIAAGDAPDLAGIPTVNAVVEGDHGPRSGPADLDIDADTVRLAIPPDIQEMKQHSVDVAREWRSVTQAAFESYLGRGYEVRELIRHAGLSHYLLSRGPPR